MGVCPHSPDWIGVPNTRAMHQYSDGLANRGLAMSVAILQNFHCHSMFNKRQD